MKNETDEVKYCKSKDCKKALPVGYKHKYCEACRNKHAENTKKTLKAVGGTVASVALVVLTAGKINPKNK
ncbi:MAG: hypothetical protein UEW45_10525 [Catenibacterium mitsuokai]|jgi:ABC-type nickel/cobalt efflux system permease component RcnA|nr:hypothetical protein [Catenibacterium mitsuokai]MEE0082434.1 hypothetical protein [Catenibacterium mitsuokai]